MSFTIKCDKCGNWSQFNNGDKRMNDKIEIIPDVITDGRVNSVDIFL